MKNTERCNCDASCGENRYHNAGDLGCRFSNDEEYRTYWNQERKRYSMSKSKNLINNTISELDKLNDLTQDLTARLSIMLTKEQLNTVWPDKKTINEIIQYQKALLERMNNEIR